MRVRLLVAVLALAAPLPAVAQQSGDEPRLIFSLTGGYATGNDLWQVPAQSLTLDGQTDIFALDRELTGTWTAGLGAIYFPGEHLGFVGEAQLVNTAVSDGCRQLSNSGSEKNAEVCSSINGASNASMSATLSLGAVLRAASREKVSPYVRLQGGGFFGNLNTTAMQGTFANENNELVIVPIYPGSSESSFSFQFTFGAGVTVPVAKAYHLRFEGRGTTYSMDVVTGATGAFGSEPNTGSKWITQFSILAGIDLVLERKRGRRY
jgi:hypothetical protein